MTHAKRVLRGLGVVVVAGGVAGSVWVVPARAQAPLTRAERTDWVETSRYGDVLGLLEELDGAPDLHRTTFGYSLEGRALPLVVVGRGLSDASPEGVLATGRTRVLLFANIHAGEVEGKEALQILLRRFAAGDHRSLLDSLVVLVAPVYNADGNERISVLNRTRQNGPLGGVGQRENVQGLDLNRDHMKLESPEARSLVGLFDAYDPHVIVDLHTTNGTRHAYHLTYSPPLHPETDAGIVRLLRGRWLPGITEQVQDDHGYHFYYYGNAFAPDGGERGWYTFDYRPRFNNNYIGLRNRVAILSEAYSYASFEERVAATLAFVEAILERAHADASEVRELTRSADERDLRGERMGVRATIAAGDEVEILMGEAEERTSRFSGRAYLARTDVVRPERMREYGTFRSVEEERVPAAYYVPADLDAVVDLLAFHGVRTTALTAPRRAEVERFEVDSSRVAEREFQGHREREAFGRWVPTEVDLPPGTVEVPMDQPLARLVFHLLEPRAADGVVNWNLVDEPLESGLYPILRRPVSR
jgi:hypothetical protein